jgi:dTDP-glucose 4,6-dehydratase
MRREPVKFRDGTPYRSYLYAADLAVWLWTILFHAKACHPYNVGSNQEVTIAELAHTLDSAISRSVLAPVSARSPNSASPSYVLSTLRIMSELGIELPINLVQAII